MRKNWNKFNSIFDYFESMFDSYDNNTFDDFTNRKNGKVEITTGEDENGTWEEKVWTSEDGSTKIKNFVRTSNGFGKPTEKNKSLKESDLKKQLKAAVDGEDYEKAAKIKKELNSLND